MNGGNTNGVPIPAHRGPRRPDRDPGVEARGVVTGIMHAFLDTQAEAALRREQVKTVLLAAFARRAENSEHREDAALAEVRRLRGLLDAECCYELNGTCRHA